MKVIKVLIFELVNEAYLFNLQNVVWVCLMVKIYFMDTRKTVCCLHLLVSAKAGFYWIVHSHFICLSYYCRVWALTLALPKSAKFANGSALPLSLFPAVLLNGSPPAEKGSLPPPVLPAPNGSLPPRFMAKGSFELLVLIFIDDPVDANGSLLLDDESAFPNGSLRVEESAEKAWKGSLALDVVLGEFERGLLPLAPRLFLGGRAGVSSCRPLKGSLLNVSVLELCQKDDNTNIFDYTGWPRKNATTLIVHFKNIVDETELFFILFGRTFIFQQNDTMIINFG